MRKRSPNASPSNFHIELLADKSVVLVEKRDHESEIFLPELQYGRISLTNVVSSRQPRIRANEVNYHLPIHRCHRLVTRKLTSATAGLAPRKMSSAAFGRSAAASKLAFELKLISNGNVVLVECNGYESEIFLPYISSHCVAMKRVCAGELAQCAFRRSKAAQIKSIPSTDAAATMAVSLAAQAVGLSKLLVSPLQLLSKEKKNIKQLKTQKVQKALKQQIEKLSPIKPNKKKPVKQHTNNDAGDS